MSIERRKSSKGQTRYVVRWRDAGRNRAKTFSRRTDALRWEAEITRRRELGQVGMLDRGRTTLAELRREWWPMHSRGLAPKSRRDMEGTWATHVGPHLGGRRLVDLTPQAVERWAHDLLSAGVGEASVEKSWVQLGAMLERAASWGWVPRNAVRLARRPKKVSQRRRVRGLAPSEVESIRGRLKLPRDRTLVSVLAYAGLRPGEALALRWGDVSEGGIAVERAVSLGEVRGTKTGRSRRVGLLAPLAQDLREWRIASGRPDDDELLFPGREGGPFSERDYRAFRWRFKAAAAALEMPPTRVYDLRHAFASLLIKSGMNVVEVAEQLGHAPTMTLDTYAHVLHEFAEAGPISVEDEIGRARGALPRRSAQGA